jgi:hypothetical protein
MHIAQYYRGAPSRHASRCLSSLIARSRATSTHTHVAKQYFGLIAAAGHGARPPRLCQPGSPLKLPVGSLEAGGIPWCRLKKRDLAVECLSRPLHRTFNDLVPLTRGGSSLTI